MENVRQVRRRTSQSDDDEDGYEVRSYSFYQMLTAMRPRAVEYLYPHTAAASLDIKNIYSCLVLKLFESCNSTRWSFWRGEVEFF